MNELPAFNQLPFTDDGRARHAWDVWRDPRVGSMELLTGTGFLDTWSSVGSGTVLPLDFPYRFFAQPLFGRQAMTHEVTGRPEAFAHDDILNGFNTQLAAQWDGFRHVRHPRYGYFGGLPPKEHGIQHLARRGIVGRGVLLDVARWATATGRSFDPSARHEITAGDLAAALKWQETKLEVGDLLFIRTGWAGWFSGLSEHDRQAIAGSRALTCAGLAAGPEMAAFLWDLHPAAVVADNPTVEAYPFTVDFRQELPDDVHDRILHAQLLPLLGMTLGELFFLEDLSMACQANSRFTFFVAAAPMPLEGACASPANCLAIA